MLNARMLVLHYESRAVTLRSEMSAECCKTLTRACESAPNRRAHHQVVVDLELLLAAALVGHAACTQRHLLLHVQFLQSMRHALDAMLQIQSNRHLLLFIALFKSYLVHTAIKSIVYKN